MTSRNMIPGWLRQVFRIQYLLKSIGLSGWVVVGVVVGVVGVVDVVLVFERPR